MEQTRKMTYKRTLLIILIIGSILTYEPTNPHAFSDEILQMGAVGKDVIELQSRLKDLGYYDGEIDGVFDWMTYFAISDFQTDYGLPFNGIVGPPTKDQLVAITEFDEKLKPIPQKGAYTNIPSGYSQNDVELMARTVHAEARGESYIGQVAVAAVILNRVNSSTFPNTISGVIFEPLAFTAVADGQINLAADEASKRAVMDAMDGLDPSGNAVYYFNPDIATSDWIWERPQIKRIGKHIFCK